MDVSVIESSNDSFDELMEQDIDTIIDRERLKSCMEKILSEEMREDPDKVRDVIRQGQVLPTKYEECFDVISDPLARMAKERAIAKMLFYMKQMEKEGVFKK